MYKVELVVDIAVKELKRNTQYEGRIMGFPVPLKFEVLFHISLLDALETCVKLGEALQVPAQVIGKAVRQTLKNQYDLKIVRENGQSVGLPPEELNQLLFQPIAIAIGLLQGKPGISEATFHIPCFSAEEMSQFRSPAVVQEYILSLNP